MESLIADLLSLASLEREGRDWLRLELVPDQARSSRPPARPSLPKAEARGTQLLVDCAEGLAAKVDAGLLEQAVINLIDNAVKYSPPDTAVSSRRARRRGAASSSRSATRASASPPSDLPRVFERFYRVDKARSRELGGTGLGLAIVRHIAMAHGGEVSVESWEGEGSTFRIVIPQA